ncbi:hypothetical protein HDU98_000983 [Podochytrium sp. JEL0797]|nr:hypothetical protein HDU98_000983 [Podochytrium sp. JEL0797]
MAPRKKPTPLPIDDPTHPNTTPFRIIERAFKRKTTASSPLTHINPPESLHLPSLPASISARLIDPRAPIDPAMPEDMRPVSVELPRLDPTLFPRDESDTRETTPALLFPTHPGIIYIPAAASPTLQRHMVKTCLREWTTRPNVTNLDTHYVIDHEKGVWGLVESGPGDAVVPRREGLGGMEAYACGEESAKGTGVGDVDAFKKNKDKSVPLGEKEVVLEIDPPTTGTPNLQPLSVAELVKKWRWSSLGWQYNWSKKIYHMDRPVQFPPELDEITRAVIGSVEGITGYKKADYKSEAGIVNFYHLPNDALMAHQDRSEINMEAPLTKKSEKHSNPKMDHPLLHIHLSTPTQPTAPPSETSTIRLSPHYTPPSTTRMNRAHNNKSTPPGNPRHRPPPPSLPPQGSYTPFYPTSSSPASIPSSSPSTNPYFAPQNDSFTSRTDQPSSIYCEDSISCRGDTEISFLQECRRTDEDEDGIDSLLAQVENALRFDGTVVDGSRGDGREEEEADRLLGMVGDALSIREGEAAFHPEDEEGAAWEGDHSILSGLEYSLPRIPNVPGYEEFGHAVSLRGKTGRAYTPRGSSGNEYDKGNECAAASSAANESVCSSGGHESSPNTHSLPFVLAATPSLSAGFVSTRASQQGAFAVLHHDHLAFYDAKCAQHLLCLGDAAVKCAPAFGPLSLALLMDENDILNEVDVAKGKKANSVSIPKQPVSTAPHAILTFTKDTTCHVAESGIFVLQINKSSQDKHPSLIQLHSADSLMEWCRCIRDVLAAL